MKSLRRLQYEAFGAFPDEDRKVTASWYPACDVFEDKEAIKIVAEVPGVTPEVAVRIVSCRWRITGRAVAFDFASTVDHDRIQASYQNGILTVSVPKAERALPWEIPVGVA